ncbi:MAG TPA: molybdopterin cofactor-binding domain-containing protein, partial [Vicinamibacterales bacterium]
LFTAQMQLVAEELCVPIDRVTLIQCDTARTPDQGTTSGAQSHPANFNQANLAPAAATAREALVRLASQKLGVPAADLVAENGSVVVRNDRGRRIGYGDLIGGRTFDLPLDPGARRRHPREWTVLGTSVPRVELPDLVTGRFEFVHNVRVPDMLHGAVVRPPRVGAVLEAVDETSVRDIPGFVRVVVRGSFVGVVAESAWAAAQAARKLKTSWSGGTPLPPPDRFCEYLRQAPSRDGIVVDSGDVDARFARAARVLEAEYRYPYQMHGSIGTSCAVADVRADSATLWSATQGVYPMRSSAAQLLGLRPEQVRVIFCMGAGCYGLNGADTVTYDAALLSRAVGRPVRVQLTRADEMAWENFGTAYLVAQRVALDESGAITAWACETWSPSRGGRPGMSRPGNVVTGWLAGMEGPRVEPGRSAPPRAFSNRSNAAPSYVTGCVGGRCGGTGTVRSERVITHVVESPFFTGPLRSPSRLQNTFAHESFMDEIAATLGVDPIEYRLRHLRDPRMREVLSAAAGRAKWEARPSPRRDADGVVARGRGAACVLYEGDNGYCAMIAEVEVNRETGAILVRRCVLALDCGPVSNPDGVRNQLEGGVIQGISRTLRETVTWDTGRVTSIDWQSYRPWYLSDPVPEIECVLIDRPDAPACGAGETSITVTAAAIGNAVFDATGVRLREVPFTPDRVRAALLATPSA